MLPSITNPKTVHVLFFEGSVSYEAILKIITQALAQKETFKVGLIPVNTEEKAVDIFLQDENLACILRPVLSGSTCSIKAVINSIQRSDAFKIQANRKSIIILGKKES